jgi:hypothetical protein
MTVSSGLDKEAVEAAFKAYQAAQPKSPYEDAWVEAAILSFLRHLKEKGPSDQAVLAGARSIGQTMGKPNHNDRSRHCFAAVLGEVISELEQSA